MGPSKSNVAFTNLVLSEATNAKLEGSPPQVLQVATDNSCCGDVFEFAVAAVSARGMTLLTRRVDSRVGWDQYLRVTWTALLPERK